MAFNFSGALPLSLAATACGAGSGGGWIFAVHICKRFLGFA